jgi:hypothetical protein
MGTRTSVDGRPALNVGLLAATARRILSGGARAFNQDLWALKRDDGCGTVACIAGHVVAVLRKRFDWGDSAIIHLRDGVVTVRTKGGGFIEDVAREALGLTVEESRALFGSGGQLWPEEYKQRYRSAFRFESMERPHHVAAELLKDLASGKLSREELAS